MLTALRGATGGIIAKTFLVLLAGSFAVWGVADVFRGSRDEVLAKVGEREIGALQFRRYFDQRLLQLSQNTGQSFTTAQARQIGLDRQILGDLVRTNSLEEKAAKMKISLSTNYITKEIAGDKRFQDANGNFSADSLRARLRQAGISEGQFINTQRSNMIRKIMTDVARDGLKTPDTLVEVVSREANEKRDVNFIVLNADNFEIKDPDDSQIEKYYKNNQSRFSVPERRVFEVLSVDAATLGKDVKIEEDKLQALYKERRNRFGTPETRTILQIPFLNVKEAEAAAKSIKEGKSFDEIAKDRKLTDADKLLGTFARKDVPDQAIADAAFALEKGGVSGPVKGRLSVFLIKVTEIVPEKIKPFDEVRDKLVKAMQVTKGRDLVLDIRDKVEDERGAGTPFKDIAQSLPVLKYKLLPPVNRAGLDENSTPVKDVPAWQRVLKAGFESEVGLEMDPIATDDDGFAWVNVSEIIASHIEPLKTAREKAVKLWKADQVRKLLDKQAKEMAEQLENGKTTMVDLAAKQHAPIKTELGIDRRTIRNGFERGDVQAIFQIANDGVAYSISQDGKTAKVMQSSPVLTTPFDSNTAEAKQIAKQLSTMTQNDVLAAYVVELQKSVGVEINQSAWSKVFQSSTP